MVNTTFGVFALHYWFAGLMGDHRDQLTGFKSGAGSILTPLKHESPTLGVDPEMGSGFEPAEPGNSLDRPSDTTRSILTLGL